MIANFFRITLRHLWKNKTYSFLNILGLAIGIVCAGFIFLWIEDEVNFDSSFAKKDRLYMLPTLQTYEGKTRLFYSSPGKLAEAVKAEIPGIAESGRVSRGFEVFSVGEKNIYEAGGYADAPILRMFSYDFLQGNVNDAFKQVNSIVISEKMATRFFGSAEAAIGKTLLQDHKSNFTVTGVIKNIPVNSTFRPDWLIPFEVYAKDKPYLDIWGANGVATYVELADNADRARIDAKLRPFISQKAEGATAKAILFSMNDWRLRSRFEDGIQSGGRITYVRMFGVIAWIILLIACINFMNLATARSEKRAREVGVRKVMGAGKSWLTLQFIGEALCMTFIAVLTGIVLMALLLPAFNALVDKQLTLKLLSPLHLAFLAGITLVCGLVAGSYPSLYLSSFNPIQVLKGLKIKAGSAAYIRKGLVVFQFSASIVLIISTVIIYQQIQHVTQRDFGFNRDNLLEADATGVMDTKFDAIRQELKAGGNVEDIALCSAETLFTGNNSSGFEWEGKDEEANILISFRYVTPSYFNTWKMELKEGRVFHENYTSDSTSIIITESLAKILGKGSALGKTIRSDDRPFQVVGVIKDFIYGDMYSKSDPVLFFAGTNYARKLIIRLHPQKAPQEAIAGVTGVMDKLNPGYPLTYKFVDEELNGMLQSEILISKLSRLFALLAIIISCLGIFGLAAYMAERRVKEIGVRKVLGASMASITTLLSKDFLKLVLLAALIAFPIAWYAMEQWLQGYAYRIGINWWVFVLAGAAAVCIALFTISFQSVKAALANPVRSLKAE